MNLCRRIQLSALLIALAVPGSMAIAQVPDQQMPMMGQGTMGPGMTQAPGVTQGDKGPGMMQGGMGPGMRQNDMGHGIAQGGMGALLGSRVTPIMNLSTEDVRSYLTTQLDGLNNKRLKVGDIKAEDGTITADIVTLDNSLVQRLKVDRHTGIIEYQN